MTKTRALLALLALAFSSAYAQAPAFEVASITPCKPGTPEPPGEHMGLVQFTSPGGHFTARATSVKFLIEWAYGLQPAQLSGGPSWLAADRYDIVASAEGNPADEQMKQMARTLLAERFHLQFHREQKPLPVYVISLGKNPPKLSPAKDSEPPSLRIAPQPGADQRTIHIVATRYSLSRLADAFARQMEVVVLNQTGLDGDYDFGFDLALDQNRPSVLDTALLVGALREQLGFALKYEKVPVDVMVVDHADPVAAGN